MEFQPTLPSVLLLHERPGALDPIASELAQSGYGVTVVDDVRQALVSIHTGRFGLVLADADLRGDAGRTLLAQLRAQWPETASVVLTDYESLEATVDVLSESSCDYVVKPCPPAVLTATIARAMERGALARSLRQGLQDLDEANAQLEALSAGLQRRVDEATEALRRKVAELEEERRRREELIAMVAHDLGNPLTALAGYVQLLRRPDVSPERQKRAHEVLASEMEHLTRLVADLTDRSRQGDQVSVHLADCDLVALIRQQVELAQVDTPGRAIELSAPAKGVRVTCDEQRIRQVVSNLIGNALKYAPDGAVRVSLREARDEVVLSVADDGPGIPSDQTAAVFEPRVRLNAEGRPGEPSGQGLGLHIARGIVEAHGGRIWVESPPGRGATFCVALPGPAKPLGERAD